MYWYPNDRETFARRAEVEGELRNEEYVMRRKDGSMLVVVDNCRVVRDANGRACGFEGTLTDITERKKAETAVFQAKERAQVTLQSIGDAVITTDSEGRIDYMNPVAESLTGWENREAQGQLIGNVLTVVDEVTREGGESPVARCLREGQVLGLAEHTVLVNRRGQEIAIQDSAAPIRDRAGNLIGAVMVFHDVSKERRLHRALHYQASHDALTGLINRREFENRLTVAVEDTRQNSAGTPRASVPGFGSIQAGERYLRTSGRRFAAEANNRRASNRECAAAIRSRVWAAMSSGFCCRTARAIRRCVSRKTCARASATIDSPGKAGCSPSARASASWKSPTRYPPSPMS